MPTPTRSSSCIAARGTLHTMFGPLPFRDVRLRRHSAMHDVSPRVRRGRTADLLVIEATGNVDDPAALSESRRPASARRPLQRARFARPEPARTIDRRGRDATVLIKDGRRLTRYTLASIRSTSSAGTAWSIRSRSTPTISSRSPGTIHQPPPVHQTFEAPGFVVCTFAPRMLDTHPEAIKVPYAHSNVQADEVLYYVRGRFGSRRGVEEASFTLHPRGIPHGPHPGTIVASKDVEVDRRARRDGRYVPAAPVDAPGDQARRPDLSHELDRLT